jgi:cyclopropane fatty-acyl-phospholipid synthase-like methyltransferase
MKPNRSLTAIRRYYDQNTRLFLAFGSARRVASIHRAVWADGARTLDEALNVTHQRILAETPGRRVADLGCGVGASLFHILPQLEQPAFGLGLTISPVQARLAQTAAERLGLASQCLIVEGDFLSVPLAEHGLDAVFSVEAFVHAPEPASYFQEAARLLRPGGRLVLVDDFRADRGLSPSESDWLAAYQAGWRVPGVCSLPQAADLAASAGLRLRRNDDLTPDLRLRALPNGLAHFLLKVGQKIPLRHAILPSMLGSMALQQCLQAGVVQYCFVVFEKET